MWHPVPESGIQQCNERCHVVACYHLLRYLPAVFSQCQYLLLIRASLGHGTFEFLYTTALRSISLCFNHHFSFFVVNEAQLCQFLSNFCILLIPLSREDFLAELSDLCWAGKLNCLCAAVMYVSCISRPLTGTASDLWFQYDLQLLVKKDKKKYMGWYLLDAVIPTDLNKARLYLQKWS